MRHMKRLLRPASYRAQASEAGLSVLLVAALILCVHSNLCAQVHWNVAEAKTVLTVGPPGSWDDGYLIGPSIIKDGDTLRMWYAAGDNLFLIAEVVQIGYAWSLDGVTWNKYPGNPVMSPRPGEWDSKEVGTPVVIKDGDTLRMWYYGKGAGEPSSVPANKIGYAWSLNGINWNRLPAPVLQSGPLGEWDSDIVHTRSVIKEGNTYKMWYYGGVHLPGLGGWPWTLTQIGLATSNDGVNWIKYDNPATTQPPFQLSDPVLQPEPLTFDPQIWGQLNMHQAVVLPTSSGYEMWFTSGDFNFPFGVYPATFDVGYATSSDGIIWRKYRNNPVLPPFGQFNVIETGSMILEGQTYRWWFDGFFDVGAGPVLSSSIGYITAPVARPAALITSVLDIPNDQGRQVRVTWNSSRFDGIDPAQTIVEYNLWRKVAGQPPGNVAAPSLSQELAAQIEAAKRFGGQIALAGGLWDFIATVPARQFARYAYVAPTLGDATKTDTVFSTFMVSAHTTDAMVFYDSAPAKGYSVDNLAPAAPQNVIARATDTTIKLTWASAPEEDFNYFAIYRSTQSGFDPSTMPPLATTIDTFFVDTQVELSTPYYYRLSTFDFAGNESDFSIEVNALVTGVESTEAGAIPKAFALHQNYPNPFNPETEIRFQLPRASHVVLKIINPLGEEIRTLVDERREAGYHRVRWDGKDNKGHAVVSGVYLYQLQAGSFSQVKKMSLLR